MEKFSIIGILRDKLVGKHLISVDNIVISQIIEGVDIVNSGVPGIQLSYKDGFGVPQTLTLPWIHFTDFNFTCGDVK